MVRQRVASMRSAAASTRAKRAAWAGLPPAPGGAGNRPAAEPRRSKGAGRQGQCDAYRTSRSNRFQDRRAGRVQGVTASLRRIAFRSEQRSAQRLCRRCGFYQRCVVGSGRLQLRAIPPSRWGSAMTAGSAAWRAAETESGRRDRYPSCWPIPRSSGGRVYTRMRRWSACC